jgi:hypothetical protein
MLACPGHGDEKLAVGDNSVGLERLQQTVVPFTAVNFRLFVYVKPYHMCVAQKVLPSSPRGEGGPTYSMCRYVLLGHVYDLYTLYELQPLVLILSAELGTEPPRPSRSVNAKILKCCFNR